MIAALFVHKDGTYYNIDGIDPWDEDRDARLYEDNYPVIAHPPCSRWCRLAGLVEARWGHKRGDDGGCFKSALSNVRRCGGVLEHPAYSDAWTKFGLNTPPRSGGWVNADFLGGWTCHVEQGRYGHPAKKATWLYAVGCDLPILKWGSEADSKSESLVSWCGNHTNKSDKRPRIGKKRAAATPEEFRDILIEMARSAQLFTHRKTPIITPL
jgi:hypothetical protein